MKFFQLVHFHIEEPILITPQPQDINGERYVCSYDISVNEMGPGEQLLKKVFTDFDTIDCFP